MPELEGTTSPAANPRFGVRLAVQSDVPAMTTSAVEAFMDDPVSVWIEPDEARRSPMLHEWYDLTFRVGLRAGHTYTAFGNQAVAVWSPPSVPQMFHLDSDTEEIAEMFRRLLGSRARSVFEGLMLFESSHPRERPHFYLSLLGTAPRSQGMGLGGALLESELVRCDTEGWPAYLETSRERNVRFYERRRFEVTGSAELPDGPPVWFMWREPLLPDPG
jgi:GNAT superfamily N-acetyltransferase